MMNDREPLTIHEAVVAMKAGVLTPIDLLDQCLARIDRYESLVRAWIVIDRDGARQQAERLTDEWQRGEVRGPLHGIPVGVKDIIDVFDLPTGCGSNLWSNSVARRDATCVSRLRAAGAVILGKTVTTPYAYLDPPVTRNPWDPTRTPGGSSSGSAAAVACGMCLAALGTQTVGSLTRPASFCGVYSYKPSVGAVPADGVLPLAATLDHVGVMGRCVADLVLLAGILEERPIALEVDHKPSHFVMPGGIFADSLEPVMTKAMGDVRELVGRSFFEDCAWPAIAADLPRHLRAILAAEAAVQHGDRFRRRPDDYPPKIRELIQEGLRVTPTDYQAALHHRKTFAEIVEDTLFRAGVALTPATLGPAPDRSTTGDGILNGPWSYSGHPTISLPIAQTEIGLPLAVQVVGSSRTERSELFRAAAWLERQIGYDRCLPPLPDESAVRGA